MKATTIKQDGRLTKELLTDYSDIRRDLAILAEMRALAEVRIAELSEHRAFLIAQKRTLQTQGKALYAKHVQDLTGYKRDEWEAIG